MGTVRLTLLLVACLASGALGGDGPELTLGLSGVPDDLVFPLPAGKNAVLTATLAGGKAKSVWLAAGRDSPGRFLLAGIGAGKYQANLADPMVAALARSAGEGGALRVFAEAEDGRTVESIAIRYGLAKEREAPLRIHVVAKGKRKALALRRLDTLAFALDREARGEKLDAWELRFGVESKTEDPGPDGWHRPKDVEAIEVRCSSRRPAEADAGDLMATLEAGREPDLQVLKFDDALREAWGRSGTLTLSCPVGERDVAIPLRAVPTVLDPAGMATGVKVHQRSSADVPGSRGYLRVRIDDISGPRVPLSLTNAEGKTLLDETLLVQGDEVRFDLGEHDYKLVVERLVNELIGNDYIRLVVRETTAEDVAHVSSARERIDALIRAVEASDAVFVREGKEYSGKEAGSHIRAKYESVQAVVRTVDDFIDRVAGASWTSGQEYRVKRADGGETGAKTWLRDELRRIEGQPAK